MSQSLPIAHSRYVRFQYKNDEHGQADYVLLGPETAIHFFLI
jgi:hypothetical protein